ncbi:MAG: DUF3301 domain-containing protein [Sulfuritalea sp.]|nr:DUF3301 domain-containing protein [Sulfuritalea sp.]
MDLLDLLGFLLLAATAWLWLDSLKARELAVAAAKAACNSEDLLLLDDTVAIQRISLARDEEGILRVGRIYGFEYSDTGNDRSTGSIVMRGSRVVVINLNLPDAPEGTVLH